MYHPAGRVRCEIVLTRVLQLAKDWPWEKRGRGKRKNKEKTPRGSFSRIYLAFYLCLMQGGDIQYWRLLTLRFARTPAFPRVPQRAPPHKSTSAVQQRDPHPSARLADQKAISKVQDLEPGMEDGGGGDATVMSHIVKYTVQLRAASCCCHAGQISRTASRVRVH